MQESGRPAPSKALTAVLFVTSSVCLLPLFLPFGSYGGEGYIAAETIVRLAVGDLTFDSEAVTYALGVVPVAVCGIFLAVHAIRRIATGSPRVVLRWIGLVVSLLVAAWTALLFILFVNLGGLAQVPLSLWVMTIGVVAASTVSLGALVTKT
ncbi:hypothetical protein EK0264_03840 [Epidermidibacterium keratini]|uniref:Uncharacterized protein n=1 Tax=Epidermidibacterium keratini TaxID=1891644 RepID=A0A7L4YK91_9ACTN|nr:hypothetical protein [Epidermidibacterium keratini]QHB99501.1 hypothetical protein EK0264_03840 [Epidermidibacterium keratini]